MKRIIAALLAAQLLITPSIAMVVSDPTSYGYYVEQIAKFEKQIEALVEQLEQMKVQTDTLMKMKQQMEGAYNRIAGLKGRLMKQADRMGAVPDSLRADLETIQRELMTNNGYLPDSHTKSDWKETDALIDAVFGDPRSPDFDPSKHADLSYQMKQRALKGSIIQSTLILDGVQKRLKALDALFLEIDSTKNLKDSQDLTNRLLAEMLDGQTQMIQLLSHMSRAAALVFYRGVTELESSKRTASRRQSTSTGTAYDKMLKEEGIKPNGRFQDSKRLLRGI